jgi:hypothetical protein
MLEKTFYEARPFIYLGLGIYALAGPYSSPVAFWSGLLLMGSAGFILRLRARWRGYLR